MMSFFLSLFLILLFSSFLFFLQTKNTSNDEKALKSSKAFFTQLQDNANSSKLKSNNKKKSTTDLSRQEGNAKRLKL